MMALDMQARAIPKLSTSDRLNLPKKDAVQREFSRLHSCTLVNFLLGAFVSTAFLAAQEPPKNTTPESGTVLRQTVRRVRLDVVVTDAQGRPVTGLRASSFRVAEDGKPQAIRQFEYHRDEVAEASLPKRPPLPPHTFMNLPTAPERGPLTVLLYDIVNTPVSDQFYAREQMIKFLKKNPGRRIAIFVLADRLRFPQGFTSDTDSILRAIGVLATQTQIPLSYLPRSDIDLAAGLGNGKDGDHAAKVFIEATERHEVARFDDRMDLRVGMTLDALKQIGRFLAGTPGRKNLIWYTGFVSRHSLSKLGRLWSQLQWCPEGRNQSVVFRRGRSLSH
ncbi:MAG: VWA domain-containing protein [Terracidiphilus sp.]